MSYFLAPALVTFRNEINALFPRRDISSDGWIGDPSHAARASDHNPDWSASGKYNGIVRAIDIDIDDNDKSRDLRRMILEAAIGDPRVWYVISNGIIYSRTYNWVARRYTGSNPHDKHVHVSLRHFSGEFNTARWFDAPVKFRPQKINLGIAKDAFLAAVNGDKVEAKVHVKRIQKALNHKYSLDLGVDGYVGEATLNAWGLHEKRTDGNGRPRVPDEKSLVALVGDKYAVVPG